jgi:hypothetical protein
MFGIVSSGYGDLTVYTVYSIKNGKRWYESIAELMEDLVEVVGEYEAEHGFLVVEYVGKLHPGNRASFAAKELRFVGASEHELLDTMIPMQKEFDHD